MEPGIVLAGEAAHIIRAAADRAALEMVKRHGRLVEYLEAKLSDLQAKIAVLIVADDIVFRIAADEIEDILARYEAGAGDARHFTRTECRWIVTRHALVIVMVEPDALTVAGEIKPAMLKRAVLEQEARADCPKLGLIEQRLDQLLQPAMFRSHDVRIQHDDGCSGRNAGACIAGPRIAAIAVHDCQLER